VVDLEIPSIDDKDYIKKIKDFLRAELKGFDGADELSFRLSMNCKTKGAINPQLAIEIFKEGNP
tara:strand:- start:17861 stop:18052 length:192 start_codon:yes stop_codon:yes gene_type:complete